MYAQNKKKGKPNNVNVTESDRKTNGQVRLPMPEEVNFGFYKVRLPMPVEVNFGFHKVRLPMPEEVNFGFYNKYII